MLTADEVARAKELGWRLEEVYDLVRKQVVLTVMPVDFTMISAAQAQAAVVRQARAADKVAIKALKLIASSNLERRSR